MRDCPACRVPLHGYEEVCPSCGTKQIPTRRAPFGSEWKPEQPRVNMVPFILVFVGLVVFLLVSMQGTWIGQLAKRGEVPEDPLAKMTFSQARNTIDSELQKNLAQVGAKNSKLTWHTPGGAPQENGQTVDLAVDGPIALSIETTLPSPDLRKQVVDPIKPFMEKAKLTTLEMSDSKSRAHWTYSMIPGATQSDDTDSQ